MNFHTDFIKTQKLFLCKHSSSLLVLLFSSVAVFTNGQKIPSLNDPFPGDAGPESPKQPYRGCPAECDSRLTDAMNLIADLERRVTTLNITVTSRLNNIPTGGSGTVDSNELSNRLVNVENYMYGNITIATNKIDNDLTYTRTTLSQDITDARNYLEDRINAIASSGGASNGGGGSAPREVFSNITARLDNLENNKVQTLIDENNVWRQNFEVVNRTFSKMKKSSYSNDVIVVG